MADKGNRPVFQILTPNFIRIVTVPKMCINQTNSKIRGFILFSLAALWSFVAFKCDWLTLADMTAAHTFDGI